MFFKTWRHLETIFNDQGQGQGSFWMNYGCVLQNTFVLYGSISVLHFVI